MFSYLGDGIEHLYKILWLLIALQLIMSGGIGFLFRLIAKPLQIGFNNRKIREMDLQLSDLQLLRLYHGINVSTIEDAELVALAISRNKLRPQKVWLMLFCPIIGKTKHGKFELFLMGFIFTYCMFSACYIAKDVSKLRHNSALISDGSGSAFISEIYVRDIKKNKSFNRSDCKIISERSSSIIKTACKYLITDDPYLKKELSLAIEKNNNNLAITIFTSLFFLFMACLIAYSYLAYREINNTFYEFKKAECKHNKIKKYKDAFKNKIRN
ncbi:hypothetical protein [Enterobacter sp. CC120223-11]|uniref:hypothetical protein n=1 Tax=Enterobacter sp. CC120223-11 TaxID=1378073 RepID=UPI000BC492D4|nr:hypothetical protein [Enterobacter sp. CC120223-11]SNY63951.1 hypothetical protein SAMN02744775_01093 [Enterobacter sp. CC120223-11]